MDNYLEDIKQALMLNGWEETERGYEAHGHYITFHDTADLNNHYLIIHEGDGDFKAEIGNLKGKSTDTVMHDIVDRIGDLDWEDLEPNAEGDDDTTNIITPFVISEEEKKDKKKWSKKPTKKAKWHPPEGLFSKSPDEIAKTLKEQSDSKKQAMARLNFYINRAGKHLSEKDKKRLNKAKQRLKELYAEEEKKDKKKKKVSQECYIPPTANW